MMFVAGCVATLGGQEGVTVKSRKSSTRKVFLVSENAKTFDVERIRLLAEEEDTVIASPAMLDAGQRYVNCEMPSIFSLYWACDREWYCPKTMSVGIVFEGKRINCEYDCPDPPIGKKCDCDLKKNQHAMCPK